MSSRIWPLLKVQIKTTLRSSVERLSGTRSKWGILLMPLLGLALLPLVSAFVVGWAAIYAQLSPMGQAHTMLVVALTAGQLVCLAFGVLYVISIFYFSLDLRILLPLPLRPGEIVLSKFIGVLLGEYLTMAPVVLPALAVYGVLADVGPLYIPFALIIYLLLPVVPLVLASLFSMVLMRVTNLRRNRDLLRVFGAVLGIGFALAFQFFGQSHRGGAQALEELVTSQQPLIQGISKYLVTSTWAADALRAGAPSLGIPPFLLYLGAVGAALYAMLLVAERMFLGGVVGSEESRSSGKRLSREELARGTGQVRSPFWAIFWRDLRLLNRNPSFLMAALLPPLMIPFFAVLPLTQAGGPLASPEKLGPYADLPWIPLVILGVVMFINTISSVPSSAISREGRWFWISRSLPVAPSVQIQAKLLHGLLFHLINLVIITGIMLWLGLATARNLAVVLVGGVLISVVTTYTGLLIDVMRPNLTWTDPQQAMKGNINGLFALLLNLVLGGVTGLSAGLLYWLARPALMPGLLAVLALEGWLLGKATKALAERRYMEYEY